MFWPKQEPKERRAAGSSRKSEARERLPGPATSIPRRIACKLKRVESAVNNTDADILVPRWGVPRIVCTANSIVCERRGRPMAPARRGGDSAAKRDREEYPGP